MNGKAQALKRAATAQKRLNAAETKATNEAAHRDVTVLEAQTLGATYAEIQMATGLSTARITQVLRRERLSQSNR